ncbi:MAG: DNA polymerase I [Spirochaetaceae bacterium]|nr:DNA polymerase I [Spirochaetaceae bacterium]
MCNKDCVYILDSYGLIYRAYFAFVSRPLVNNKNENVSAVFGFFRNFLNVLKNNKPGCIAAAFDSRVPTFRHEMYPEYKATRDKTPEDLHAQVPVIEEILVAMGVPVLRRDTFEADDVIATVARQCRETGRECRILSGDKDLMQLVTDTTLMLIPDKTGGWAETGKTGVAEKWGVGPELMLDMLSLTGDTADNVPGVKGIGEKTAAKLLLQYGSLDGIYEHADEIKGAVGEKIRNGKDDAYFSRKLIVLRDDVPVDIDFSCFCTDNLNYDAAAELLFKAGVPAVAKQFAAYGVEKRGGSAPGGSTDTASVGAAVSGNKLGTPGVDGAGAAGSQVATSSAETAAMQDEVDGIDNADGYSTEAGLIMPVKNAGNYRPIRTAAELDTVIEEILACRTAGIDTETDSLNPLTARMAGFSLSWRKGEGVYVPLLVTDMLLAGDMVSKADALERLASLFTSPDMTLVFHNAKFDLQVFATAGLDMIHNEKNGGARRCRIVDTMIAAWLLQPDRLEGSYSLEKQAENRLHLKGTEYEEIVPKNSTFLDLPIEVAYPYAAEDADFTLQLWNFYEPFIKDAGFESLFALEMDVLPVLASMERNGIRLEKKPLEEYKTELTEKINVVQKEIYDLVGHEFNIASPKQLSTVLFEELQLPHGKKTKSGYSTDTSVLEELAAAHPVPYKILEYRGMTKLLSTYVETLPSLADAGSRVHTSFIQTGTATGRLSSRDPNLQNIPVRDESGRRIRSAFVAQEGRLLVTADYSQIELVVLAHLSKDENMCRAFRDGVDIHKATAALIYGVEPDVVSPDMRRTAKTINFGVIYGMSAFRLASSLGIPRRQAQDFIDSYFEMYSGINKFVSDTVQSAAATGYVETILGRKRRILNIASGNHNERAAAERIAVNTPVQGSAADIVKMAMVSVYHKLSEQFPSARLLLQVHDELIAECDEKDAAAVAAMMKETMENVIKLEVPLRVSVEYGKNWGEFH